MSTDAINGSQLYSVANTLVANLGNLATSTASALGNGATVSANGALTNPGFTIGGTTYTTVEAALQAIDTAALAGGGGGGGGGSGGWKLSANGGAATTVPSGATVNVGAGPSGNLVVTKTGTDISVDTSLRPTFDEVSINGGAVLSSSGITNLADGAVNATSKDAVNGAQLYGATASVASALGGGSAVGANGAISTPTYEVYGANVSGVQGAVSALQAHAPLQYSNSAGVAAPQTPSDDVTLVGSDTGPVIIHNLAAGVANTDAINVQQLNNAVANIVAGVNPYGVNYSQTTANTIVFSSPNNGGTAGAAVTLTNVAPGALSATSTDAVNGAQLFATNQAVANLSAFAQTVQKQAYAGTAVGLAAAGLRYDDRPGKVSTAAAFGYYHGQTGFAGGVGATSTDGRWRLNAAVSLTPGNGIQPDVGVTGGVSFTWN